jgi:DNA invertase Pin-like site-specific DNA recombinase
MKKIAYVRISTPEQRHDRQIDGLRDLCDELEIETLSACSAKRPVYEGVIARLEPGDMLVVWALDRAYRNTKDALNELDALRDRGIHFQIANLNLDTSTPAGIFIYTILSALAEFERRNLSLRTKEGMDAARKRGVRIGRPPTLNERQLREARSKIENQRKSISIVAQEMGVPRWTLTRSLRRIETSIV